VKTWYVYIARCGDGTLYTGIATDLSRRLSQHSAGTGARYTRGRGGVSLHHWEAAPTKGAALRREAAIKRLSREAKLSLADAPGIRPATPADLALIRRTLVAFDLDLDRVSHEQFFVAHRGRTAMGFARIKPGRGLFELGGVAVFPRYRRRGVGESIVRRLVERFPSRKVWILTLIPRWFARFGFKASRAPRALVQKKNCCGHATATAMALARG
jgi:putative endonuclease